MGFVQVRLEVVAINFINQHRLWADKFQITPHRQAVPLDIKFKTDCLSWLRTLYSKQYSYFASM